MTLFSAIFSLCKAKIDSYTTAASEGLNVCQGHREKPKVRKSSWQRNKCDNIQAGALLRFVAALGFYPVEREKDGRSANEINQAFENIECVEEDGHKRCDVLNELESEIGYLLENNAGLLLSDFMPWASMFLPNYDAGLSYPFLRENDRANSRTDIHI